MTDAGRMVRGEFRPWQPTAPGRYCLAVCYCGTCENYTPAPVAKPKPARAPKAPPRTPTRLIDKAAWLVRFTDYVRALPVGTTFTTAEMHGKIPDPPSSNDWGHAQKHVARLGLTRKVMAQRSELETTKGSLAWRWERIDEAAQDVA